MPPKWFPLNTNHPHPAQVIAGSRTESIAGSRTESQFAQLLAELIGPARHQKWFAGRTTLTITGDVLTIGIASPFMIKWMVREFQETATLVARECLGLSAQVRFEVDPRAAELLADLQQGASAPRPSAAAVTMPTMPETLSSTATSASGLTEREAGRLRTSQAASGSAMPRLKLHGAEQLSVQPVADQTLSAPAQQAAPAGSSSAPSRRQENAAAARKGRLAPRRRRFARLDDFIVGPGNHVPLSMAQMVSEHPGEQYNPLYFYGNVGIGKTHLLEGIHVEIRNRYPELSVTYLTAEAFANYYTKALRDKSLPAFRQRFRSIDVLLVDDIDFLDSKKGIQEEFCHTLQELLSYGRQVVLAADRHPRMLTNIRPDLCTRFLSGLVTRLEAPDEQTRREIVRHNAGKLSLPISEDAVDYIARKFTRNVRELIGALNCMQTYHHLTKRNIGITATREVLRDLERDCLKIIRACDIQQAVCELFGVQQTELVSSKRTRNLTQPRMLAMYLTRQWTQSAYHEIGKQFGGRNHSTVISAEKKMKEILSRNESIQISTRQLTAQEVIAMLEEQLQVG